MDDIVTGTYLLLSLIAGGAALRWMGGGPTRAPGRHGRVVLRAAGIWLLSLLAPAALLLLLVGIEELAGRPLVPERIALVALALTALQAVAGGIVLTVLLVRSRS